jgi:uncharacterized membrane protein
MLNLAIIKHRCPIIVEFYLAEKIRQVSAVLMHGLLFSKYLDSVLSHLCLSHHHLVNLITFKWPNQQIQ